MQVEYSNTARKQLKKLPKTEKVKILKKIQVLKENPLAGKKLTGIFVGLRSVRAWPYRIVYQYSLVNRLVFINAIEHRQGAYK